MNDLSAEFSRWHQAANDVLDQLVAYLPTLVGAVLVLIVGWVLAKLVARGTIRLLAAINVGTEKMFGATRGERLRVGLTAIRVCRSIAFWIVILIAVTVASRLLGLEAFFAWLDQTVAYLPTLLAGGLIIAGGYLLSLLVRDITETALSSAQVGNAKALGSVAQVTTLAAASVIGINQIGIDVTFLIVVVGILLATGLGGMAFAFAGGARSYVGNLIAARSLRQQYRVGQRIVIHGVDGEIVSHTPTSVVLDTSDGRVSVPARFYLEEPTMVRELEAGDE
ncbi:MAG: mechanosensitive ion channel family protein [Alphaproteobacteria bacterium]